MRTIDADALSAFVGDLRSALHKEQSTFKAMTQSEFEIKDNMLLNFQYAIDNAPTVEPYQGEERVNIKMSEEEIKQFKQMLREHNLLYTVTSNTFVEGASVERSQGEWIDDNELDSYYANCSCCGYQIDTHYECGYLNFCPNCGADMRGGRE